jgi:hypothetical protein
MGLVRVSNREVEIVEMDGLKSFSRSTRRQIDEPVGPAAAKASLAARPPLRARADDRIAA